MKKTLLSLFCVVFSLFATYAQNDLTTVPYSFTHNSIALNIDHVDMPAVDADKLLAEDAVTEKGTPLRVGIVHSVDFTFENSGRTDILPDGSRLWRLAITSPDATLISVIFSKFNIPEGAMLHVYSSDRTQVSQAYTNEDYAKTNGYMGTLDIVGDEITLEYYEPADAAFRGEIQIERVSHIYRDIMHLKNASKGYWGDAEGDCHINAICSDGDPWRDQINSVVCILISENGESFMCSGAMINNVRQDKTPYVLTANHCSTASNAVFRFLFDYQTHTCDGTSGYNSRIAYGGEVIASAGYNGNNNLSSSSDFLLLKITGEIPASAQRNLVFAGWDASGSSSVGIAVHHPGGDYKKISFPRVVASPGGTYNKYWIVGWYSNPNRGCTEQGSSGSPLFNANGRIIGDLSTGSSACDNMSGTDSYGKFSYSWTNSNNSNNARKLKPWLDPDNTGALSMPGMRYDGTPVGVENYITSDRTFIASPNPSDGRIFLKGSFEQGNALCNVYDAAGTLVHSSTVDAAPTFQMNLSNLSDGIYFMEIVQGKKVYNSKLVIVK